MNFFAVSDAQVISIVALCFSALTAILWLIIGWRAMRAHERLAQSHESVARAASFLASRFGQETPPDQAFIPRSPQEAPRTSSGQL